MEKIPRNVSLKHRKSRLRIFLKIKKITGNFWEYMEIFKKMLKNLCKRYNKMVFSFSFFFLFMGNVFENIRKLSLTFKNNFCEILF